MIEILRKARKRNLVCAERALDRDAVDLVRPHPALRRAHDDHGPLRASCVARLARPLQRTGLADDLIERSRHPLAHLLGLGAGHDAWGA